MKKSEIALQFDYKATTFLFIAAVVLTLNSVLNNIVSSVDVPAVLSNILAAFVSLSALFSYIMTIKGFSTVNKFCKLSEDNQNYYMGKNLTVLTVVCIVIGIILSFAAIFLSAVIAQYEQLDHLTPDDEKARMNLMIITAVVNILLQITAISTPFIVYLWKLRGIIPAKDKLSDVALLTVIVMVVQLIIGIMNSAYIVKNSHSSFLTSFSEILLTVKYLLLTVFFWFRRNKLIASVPDEE